jgi:hypothetical protein
MSFSPDSLIGARVLVKILGSGEVGGYIKEVLSAGADRSRDEIIISSVFLVKLDIGGYVEVAGSQLSSIEPMYYPPELA